MGGTFEVRQKGCWTRLLTELDGIRGSKELFDPGTTGAVRGSAWGGSVEPEPGGPRWGWAAVMKVVDERIWGDAGVVLK